MVNNKLLREVESNKKGNIIFNDQKASDLEELKTILEKRKELVVDFPVDEWDKVAPHLMNRNDMTQLQATRGFIALKILNVLKEKCPDLKKYYEENRLYDFAYIDAIMKINNINPERIHFIMNGNKSAILCDALSILLSEEYNFDVSIYLSPNNFYTTVIPDYKEKVYLWQEYSYTSYYENEEGETNTASRKQFIKK